MIAHLYHCTPEELDRQDDFITSLHVEFMNLEAAEKTLQDKRAAQEAKMNSKLNK